MNRHRLSALMGVTLSMVVIAIPCRDVFGQSNNRGMMAIDDGNGEFVLSFAEPNVELITRPFVNRRDLPLFVDYLVLSDAQAQAVKRLIEKYLEDFSILLAEKHPQPAGAHRGMFARRPAPQAEHEKPRMREDDDPGDQPRMEEGNDVDGEQNEGDGPLSSIDSILLDEIQKEGIDIKSLDDLPVEPMIGVGISVGGPVEGALMDAPPEPEVSVSIGFQGEDDSLDEGLRAKLEAAAQRAVPRMAEAVRQQQLTQMMEGGGLGGEGAPPAEELEKRYQELEALRARVEEFLKAKKALLASFYSNVKKLLSEEQRTHWPALERALTRVKTLPWGELDGEQVDLIAVAKELALSDDERAAINSALAEYEVRLHELLLRRNELLETADAEIDRALHDRQFDKALSAADRLARSRVAVRDLNDRTTETLGAAIVGRSSTQLRNAALAEAYPRIWRQTIGQQAFYEAILLEDLDPELQALMLEQAGTHAQLMSEVNDRLWQSVRREQANRLKMELESTVARYKGEETGPMDKVMADIRRSIRDAFQERQDLDVRSMKNLYASLPAEMVAKLPSIPTHDVGAPVRADHSEHGGMIILGDDDE